MAKPLIGITCGTSEHDRHATHPYDRLNHAYSAAVAESGGTPVILPNAGPLEDPIELLRHLDGLLLSGGYDVAPCRYGEHPVNETVKPDPLRDEAELAFIPPALSQGMPILAVCRGIQVLNVAMGGTLVQDIPSQTDSAVCHSQTEDRDRATHAVRLASGSRLRGLLGAEPVVNSFHHQAVSVIGRGLRVVGEAPDGIVEALEGEGDSFILGVQWHPEEMIGVDETARKLFRAFIRAAGEFGDRRRQPALGVKR